MSRFITIFFILAALSTSLLIDVRSAAAQTPATRLSPAEAKRIIGARSLSVVRALKQRDMRRLSSFVHPDKGLRFSPYVYVQSSDRVFTRWQVATLFRNNRRYLWGDEDGTGDPLRLTARQFFNGFIYDKDFLRAKEVNYNTVRGRGNTINNILDFYPRAIAVEYYLPGTNPRYSGMDWGSLWLAFEQKGNSWYLVGLASDEWTT
ncbi:MAG TPA: hypothetical protein VEQ40_00425 [Pyrinomonadaceae bacterium]|nr:hypothetical protein [Pyrinomonadaceae bacterium]